MGRKKRAETGRPVMPAEASWDFLDVVNRVAVGGGGGRGSFKVLDCAPKAYHSIDELNCSLPWYHSSTHLRKEVAPLSEGGHAISLRTMERLPALLADPVAVFMPEEAQPSRYHVVLDETNADGKPIVAVVDVNGSVKIDGRKQDCIFIVTVTERVKLDRMVVAVCKSHKVALMHAGRLNALLECCGMRAVELAWDYERMTPEPTRSLQIAYGSSITCSDANGNRIMPGSLVSLPSGRIVRAEFISAGGFVYDDALAFPELATSVRPNSVLCPRIESSPKSCRVAEDPWRQLAGEIEGEVKGLSGNPEDIVDLVVGRCRDLVLRRLLITDNLASAAVSSDGAS